MQRSPLSSPRTVSSPPKERPFPGAVMAQAPGNHSSFCLYGSICPGHHIATEAYNMHEGVFCGPSSAKQPRRFGSVVVLNYGRLQVAFCGLLLRRVGISIFISLRLLSDAVGLPGHLHSRVQEADSPSPRVLSGAGPAARADCLPCVVWARRPGVDAPPPQIPDHSLPVSLAGTCGSSAARALCVHCDTRLLPRPPFSVKKLLHPVLLFAVSPLPEMALPPSCFLGKLILQGSVQM